MGKYGKLIAGLFVNGKFQETSYKSLVKANSKAFKPLVDALIRDKNPDIRETCAEILSERNSPKAIPFLIEALRDRSLFVRQDAFWAIESISGYKPDMLQDWLKVTNVDPPTKLYGCVSEWWQLNRKYIERI